MNKAIGIFKIFLVYSLISNGIETFSAPADPGFKIDLIAEELDVLNIRIRFSKRGFWIELDSAVQCAGDTKSPSTLPTETPVQASKTEKSLEETMPPKSERLFSRDNCQFLPLIA